MSSAFKNMAFSKCYVWLRAVALLAVCESCRCAGARRTFTPTDSILDIIDTEQVERMLAARRRTDTHSYLQRNELDEEMEPTVIAADSTELHPPTLPRSDQDDDIQTGMDFRKILKSSRNALVVTRKEYLKTDWCKTETLVQKVHEPGCLTKTVLNKFCYGQCNSFYIPRGPRRRRTEDDERPPPAFKSCSFCRPKKIVWETVTLRCPHQTPPYRRKKIQRIKQCKCLPVGVN